MKKMRKGLALLLALALVLGNVPAVSAAEHVHDGTCGYDAGAECAFDHSACDITTVTACNHTEHVGCNFVEGRGSVLCHVCSETDCGFVAEIPCDCGQTPHTDSCAYTPGQPCTRPHGEGCGCAPEIPDSCDHVCSEESGCITVTHNCLHPTHDESCGWRAASPCTYVAPALTCSCGTDDTTHATYCDLYTAPENPECKCAIPCGSESLNFWCDVCGIQGEGACEASGDEGWETYADSGTCGDNLTWTYDESTATLTITGTGAMDDYDGALGQRPGNSYSGDIKNVVVGDGVTGIGNFAFYGFSSLTSVTLPNSVTSIGNNAFANCTGLTSITLPNSVTSIGNSAFESCIGLTSITIPAGVTSIGASAFANCSGLTGITIPASVTSIGEYAFASCTKLTSITILEGVKSIGKYAFSGCSGLTSITIPDSVTSIDDDAFASCTRLTSINIPGTVTSISDGTFNYCSGLTSITISEGVKSIGNSAFNMCTSLTSITIPGTVTSIGEYAFDGCTSLTSVTIPGTVTSISYGTFNGCSGLTSVTISEDVESIGGAAFAGCSGLTSITIPAGVTSIGDSAFKRCSGLTSITIPDSVTSIGENAFLDCTGLTTANVPCSLNMGSLPEGVTVNKIHTGDATYTLSADGTQHTVSYSGCGHQVTENHKLTCELNEAGSAITASCELCKNSGTATINAVGKTYDGTAVNVTVEKTGIWQNSGIHVNLTKDGKDCNESPIKAGTYTASMTLGEGENAATASLTFTIGKKPVTAAVTAKNKEYDGNTDAELDITIPNGLVDTESLTFSGTGTFDTPAVGKDKTVTIDSTKITVTGDTADCYAVTYPATVTADILGHTITFDPNGGSGTMEPMYTAPNGKLPLPQCTFTAPAGKHFKGWATSADGEVLTDEVAVTQDTTLYAVWFKAVASITNGTVTSYYMTPEAAVQNWTENTTLTLLDNVTNPGDPATLTVSYQDCELELNNKTISGYSFYVNNDLTVMGPGRVTCAASGGGTIQLYNSAKLTVDGGAAIENTTGFAVQGLGNGVILKSGTLIGKSVAYSGSNFTAESGTIQGHLSLDNNCSLSGNVTINGTIYTGESPITITSNPTRPWTVDCNGLGTFAVPAEGVELDASKFIPEDESLVVVKDADGSLRMANRLPENVTFSEIPGTYNGNVQQPTVSIRLDEETQLEAGKDYTVSYEGDFKNAGQHTVTVTGMGNYGGTVSKTYTIAPAELTFHVTVKDKTYDGTTGAEIDNVVIEGLASSEILVLGTDFTITAAFEDADAGEEKPVTLTCKLLDTAAAKNYDVAGAVIPTLPAILSRVVFPAISLPQRNFTYTGKAQEPAVTVTDGNGNVISASEYIVTYSDNIEVGPDATVTVTDKDGGNYKLAPGNAYFGISHAKLTITADSKSAYVNAATPEFTYTVTGLVNGEKLVKAPTLTTNADFTKVGTYAITARDAEASRNYSITYVDGIMTILARPVFDEPAEEAPSSKPAAQTPAPKPITVPISNEADTTVHVQAEVKAHEATIRDFDVEKLNQVVGDQVETVGTVTVDFSDLKQNIETVNIPTSAIAHIAEAAADAGNDTEKLEIILDKDISIEFDAIALNHKIEQAEDQAITITVQPENRAKDISKVQKEAIGNRTAYEVRIASGDGHIAQIDGEVTVSVAYTLKKGETAEGLRVYAVDETGELIPCETEFDSETGRIRWKTGKHSLYVIAWEEPTESIGEEKVPEAHSPVTPGAPGKSSNSWLLVLSGICLTAAAALGAYLFLLWHKPGKFLK